MKKNKSLGFTLNELLICIAIILLLAGVIYVNVTSTRDKARLARAMSDMESIRTGIELYRQDNDGRYPVNDGLGALPPGLGPYLPGGVWPDGPWPGSKYDWDNVENIDNPTLTNTYDGPGEIPGTINEADDNGNRADNVVQISLRPTCDNYETGTCHIGEPWKSAFNFRSSIYFCIRGACRPHPSFHVSEGVMGYCINAPNPVISADICQH